jgi:hypothetical protein
MSYPYIIQQTIGEPLANPWYTPGWSSQNPDYTVVPSVPFTLAGFPASAVYVTVGGNYFDADGNPMSGYLTFWPSTSLTLTSDSVITVVPQRLSGINMWDSGDYWGDGKMYLRYGKLLTGLLATDNASVSMTPVSFTYHVKEHFLGGREYDIYVPSSSTGITDINSLIIPGSAGEPCFDDMRITLSVLSTEYISVNISSSIGGTEVNPTSDVVQFAFIAGPSEPVSDDWNNGSWASDSAPYVAEILVGPDNGGISLVAGSYIIWVKVISDPEVPVFSVGTLIIY